MARHPAAGEIDHLVEHAVVAELEPQQLEGAEIEQLAAAVLGRQRRAQQPADQFMQGPVFAQSAVDQRRQQRLVGGPGVGLGRRQQGRQRLATVDDPVQHLQGGGAAVHEQRAPAQF